MKKLLVLIALATTALLNADYSDTNGKYRQGNNGYTQGNLQESDDQLSARIKETLRAVISKRYSDVNVSVNNGSVNLTGTVTSEEDKNNLEQRIRSIPGVKTVNNQIRVQGKATNGNR